MKAIRNGKLVLEDRIEEGVILFDEKIRAVGGSAIPEDAEVIDAEGKYVLPGLIDVHIHGFRGEDASDGDPDGLRRMAEALTAHGVTSFLPTTMTLSLPTLAKAFDAIASVKEESRRWNGAQILGAHAEGPFIHPKKKGAQDGSYILPPDFEILRPYRDLIRKVTLAPETDPDHAFIRRAAKETDWSLSVGHTTADYEEAMNAIRDGITSATHLFNAMTGLEHRAPGTVGAALTSDIYCELIADTFHVHPALFPMLARQKGDRMLLITDCMRAGGMPDGTYTLGGQPVIVKGITCRLPDQTIAGSVLTLERAVWNFMTNTDLSLPDAVRLATLSPARSLGLDKRKGSLAVGKDADLFLADENLKVRSTFSLGRLVYHDKNSAV